MDAAVVALDGAEFLQFARVQRGEEQLRGGMGGQALIDCAVAPGHLRRAFVDAEAPVAIEARYW